MTMTPISAKIRLGRVRFVVADANSVRAARVLQDRLEAFLQRSPNVVCTPEVLAARRL